MSPPSLDSIKESTDKAVSFVEWLAEVWRSKNWVRKLVLLDVVLFVAFNPFFFPEILKRLPWPLAPPPWYLPVFWSMVVLTFMAALVVAVRTRPTQPSPEPPEAKALKGLRPFGFDDAEVFARLQRVDSLRDCLAAITDRDFRFGILCGESGCGKSSFLQAGLWPRLLRHKVPHYCVYVKFTDLDPLNSIRQALCERFPLIHEKIDEVDFLTLLGAAAPSGSPPLVLLFDQFEQFFVHHPLKEDREPLLQGFARWYNAQPPLPVKILVCLRGDFFDRTIELQKAMGYALGPGQIFQLEKFTPGEATEIFRVIAETEGLTFDEDFVREIAAQELVDRADGLVSPVDMQILAWMIKGQRTADERAFTRSAYHKLGGLEGLLERFLSRALQARETETRRQAALKVLLAMVDLERNTRAGVLTCEDVGTKLADTVAAEEIQEAVTWLARSDVRLVTPVKREAAQGYELAHERLIPALRRLAGKELSLADQANQLLDRRVNEWLGNNRARRYLLTRRELRLIRKQNPYLMCNVGDAQGSERSAAGEESAPLARARRSGFASGSAASSRNRFFRPMAVQSVVCALDPAVPRRRISAGGLTFSRSI